MKPVALLSFWILSSTFIFAKAYDTAQDLPICVKGHKNLWCTKIQTQGDADYARAPAIPLRLLDKEQRGQYVCGGTITGTNLETKDPQDLPVVVGMNADDTHYIDVFFGRVDVSGADVTKKSGGIIWPASKDYPGPAQLSDYFKEKIPTEKKPLAPSYVEKLVTTYWLDHIDQGDCE